MGAWASYPRQYPRARGYDPATGRFNRLDPFAGLAHDPQSLHKYLYAHADPIMSVDPTGEFFTFASMLLGNALRSTLSGVQGEAGLNAFFGIRDVFAGENALRNMLIGSAVGVGIGAVAGVAIGAGISLFAGLGDSYGTYFARISPEDLGVRGVIYELDAVFGMAGDTAILQVKMISGEIANPLGVIGNVKNMARARGAKTLRIEATIANEDLLHALNRRYGVETRGGIDIVEISL